MGTIRPQLEEVKFACEECLNRWSAEPQVIEDDESRPWHPHAYFADCPRCGEQRQAQDKIQRSQLKAWARSAGPTSDAGRAKAQKNLAASNRTPESYARSRFNNLQHGMYARTARFFPAVPGRYPECDGCEYRETTCEASSGCQKRVELYMRHELAVENKDPSLLAKYRADTQATVYALLEMIMMTILEDGVKLQRPVYNFHQESGELMVATFHDAESGEERTVYDISAHPLLKTLTDILSKNNMSLADMALTPKVQEDSDAIEGQFRRQEAGQASALEHQRKMAESMEALSEVFNRAQKRVEEDPKVIEYRDQQGEL